MQKKIINVLFCSFLFIFFSSYLYSMEKLGFKSKLGHNQVKNIAAHCLDAQPIIPFLIRCCVNKNNFSTAIISSTEFPLSHFKQQLIFQGDVPEGKLFLETDNKNIELVSTNQRVYTIVISVNLEKIALWLDKKISIFHGETGKLLKEFPAQSRVLFFAFNDDCSLLYGLDREDMISIWEVDNGQLLYAFEISSKPTHCFTVEYINDKTYIALYYYNQSDKLTKIQYDTTNFLRIHTLLKSGLTDLQKVLLRAIQSRILKNQIEKEYDPLILGKKSIPIYELLPEQLKRHLDYWVLYKY